MCLRISHAGEQLIKGAIPIAWGWPIGRDAFVQGCTHTCQGTPQKPQEKSERSKVHDEAPFCQVAH
jgi:hypothetical protein